MSDESTKFSDEKVNLIINKISKQKYDELSSQDKVNDNELYLIEDESINGGGLPISNVGYPTNDTDAATRKYVDDKIEQIYSLLEELVGYRRT